LISTDYNTYPVTESLYLYAQELLVKSLQHLIEHINGNSSRKNVSVEKKCCFKTWL